MPSLPRRSSHPSPPAQDSPPAPTDHRGPDDSHDSDPYGNDFFIEESEPEVFGKEKGRMLF
ncbi:hypothetical protein EST38_g8916 [Candolleomyces aberdarensis]|uniref:Uncharacterized protein n=1 Tax=Candolleomyces aberdarensis TaxID=2316362 RepID=A0A4V1Q308_9AGAR|nr:hypothetical protein EST38_g8916 [Candolleomyces aberdarensis]